MEQRIYKPGENYKYPLIIKKLLNTPLTYSPNKEIVYRDRVRLTYRTLYERINRLANGLEKLGVKSGNTVCVFDYDSHRYLEAYFAVPMMGAVLHTMNWRLPPETILYTMNHAEDDIVLVHADFLPLLEGIWPKLTTVKKVILLKDDPKTPETKIPISIEYEEMLKDAQPAYDFPDLDENTRATIFYTTGTTGLPKGVYFSHRQLVLHTLGIGLAGLYESGIGKFRSNDVYMPLTPMFHVHAWGVPYLATLLGTKQVYPGRYEPETILKLIQKENVTFSHCVPAILLMVISHPMAKNIDLSHWQLDIGGSALPRGLAKSAFDLGIKVWAAYGMSETCPAVTFALLKEHMQNWDMERKLDILVKTGVPFPLCEVEIMDNNDNFLPHDGKTNGELVIRTPWLTESYYKDPERTKELWRKGWLHSGDVANIDEEGYVMITDRLKDVIKTGGEWVSSLMLESLISQHEAVNESAVIGIPDVKWGERPLALVVLKPEYKGKVTSDDIKTFMTKFVKEGKISSYSIPDRIEIVESIQKTSVGKINKIALKKQYAG
jgi:fatty-acyl-CoA synthase